MLSFTALRIFSSTRSWSSLSVLDLQQLGDEQVLKGLLIFGVQQLEFWDLRDFNGLQLLDLKQFSEPQS